MNDADKSLGEAVQDVSEKASRLVREEIELAKAEVTEKAKKLGKGAAVGIVAGVILVFALSIFLHALSWFFNDLFNIVSAFWVGFLITFGILVVIAVIAGLLAKKWISGGSPPTPDLAIEQAKQTKADFEHQKIERDQVGRSLERGKELQS